MKIGAVLARAALVAALIGLGGELFAQDQESPGISVSYFGRDVFHPGLEIGFDWPIATARVNETGRDGSINVTRHQWIVRGNVGFYYHEGNQLGLFVNAETGYRLVFAGGFRIELMAGLGYEYAFLDGTAYSVDDSGNVSTIPAAGNSYFMPMATLGVGYDIPDQSAIIKNVFLNLGAFWQYPFNNGFLLNPMAEVGCVINITGATK